MALKPEVKKAWVEALRSGKYVQLRGALHQHSADDKVHCCALGVLNDISGLGRWQDDLYVVEPEAGLDTHNDYWMDDAWEDRVIGFPKLLGRFLQPAARGTFCDDYEVHAPTAGDLADPEIAKLAKECLGGEEEFLHSAVADWAGLENRGEDDLIEFEGTKVSIPELNDGLLMRQEDGLIVRASKTDRLRGKGIIRLSFEEIADLLEGQL
jgi:hypothetical protein